MTFKKGSVVVYPHHGVASITGIEKREFDGEVKDHLVISVPGRGWETSGAMTVRVPVDRADDIGLRPPVNAEEADEVMHVLAVTDVRVPTNWSRRFKNHQEKLRSGDIYSVAEVVRNLALRNAKSALSAAEKTMYAAARRILVSELAVSWEISEDDTEIRIDEVLARTGEEADAAEAEEKEKEKAAKAKGKTKTDD